MKKQFYKSINSIALSKNEDYFILSGETPNVGKYDALSFKTIKEIENDEDIYSIILSNDEKHFFLGGS